MKFLNKVFMGAATLVLLTACGPSKVSYEKFHEKAVEAVENAPDYVKVVGSGTVVYSSITMNIDCTLELNGDTWEVTDGDEISAVAVLSYAAMTADLFAEDEDTTYYAGNGFKAIIKTDEVEGKAVWNKYGYLTSMKSDTSEGSADVTLKWSA